MYLKTLVALVLCLTNSFVGAMDPTWPTSRHEDSQPSHQAMTSTADGQGIPTTPEDSTVARCRNNSNPNQASKQTPRTITLIKPIDQGSVDIDALVNQYLDQGDIIKKQFPKMFSKKTLQELYPKATTPTELLQIGMVRNDFHLVQACLHLVEYDKSFSHETAEKIKAAIESAEKIKSHCLAHAPKTKVEGVQVFPHLCQTLNLIEEAEHAAFPEVNQFTGPGAVRKSLTTLCGSPEDVTQHIPFNHKFKKSLVVGLCSLLLPAHQEKAKSFDNPADTQSYLDHLSKINSAVWDAYEKNPNEFERLLQLKYDVLRLVKKYVPSEIINIFMTKNDNNGTINT